MPVPADPDDLPRDLERVRWLYMALREMGFPPGTVFPNPIFKRMLSVTVGSSRNVRNAAREALRSTGTFDVYPPETRGGGMNFWVLREAPDYLLPDWWSP